MEMRLSQNLSNISKIFNDTTQKPNCGCLPGCFSLGYAKTQSSSSLVNNPRIRKRYLTGKPIGYFRYLPTYLSIIDTFIFFNIFTRKREPQDPVIRVSSHQGWNERHRYSYK
uniref:Uncharacterized protein n=1 Tax=Cacopsylla melanoneura TaxID=428564 RepID=A0A8D9BRE6_9HEMI